MLWESSAFHVVPFPLQEEDSVASVNTRSRPLGVADLCAAELLHGRTTRQADRIACEEQSALGLESFELVVGLLLGVSALEFDEEDPQAEKARRNPRTETTVRLRRTRLLRAL